MKITWLGWIGIVVAALILGAWLAGMILLMLIGENPETAMPWTHIQYAQYRVQPEYWYSIGGVLALFVGILAAAFGPKGEKVHGDASWATENEIRKAGLRATKGILLGKKGGRFLMTDAPAHVLLVAPTRSGKGVGVIIPNLLNFEGSAVVLDIKRENFEITAGFRKSLKHGVFLWSPMAHDGRSHRYNPLAEVRENKAFRITDLQLISSYLIPLPEKNPVWDQLARQLFTGLCMYVLDDPNRDATIGEVYRTLNATGGQDFAQWIDALVKNPPDWLDPECDRLLSAHAAMTAKERAFVRTSLNSALGLWSSPLVDAATAVSDFTLGDLRKRRMSIYVGVAHSQMSALRPLLSLFFQQVIGKLSESQPGPDEPHKVLVLLDEFASLGKMESISSAVTMLAGYGGRLMFVLQGLGTLEEHYGRAGGDVIVQNCAKQIFFAPNDETTARYVVSRLGRKTVRQRSKSVTKGSTSRQTSETGRDLMMPQELRTMGDDEEIVFSEGAAPVRGKKLVYFEDKAFKPRLLATPEIPSLDLDGKGATEREEPEPIDEIPRNADASTDRQQHRLEYTATCAAILDQYQQLSGKGTPSSPVFDHLKDRFQELITADTLMAA